MNAKNFAGDALREAIDKCRTHGVRTNITLNTLVHNREMKSLLSYVEQLYNAGCDALIVADIGAARLIHQYFPDLELHASTQAAGHNLAAAETLAKLGFSRMVAARELSFADLTTLCSQSPIETEMFIHGAICVSQSGQCLASSLIGGRSGNRGECAQPCRLPYRKCGDKKAKDTYALSIKDMCLASHITEILSLGAASLKIEGRMKSPDYVYGVTSIYRRLLDERRNAAPNELAQLKALFSRSGFTDGYFIGKLGREMLGIRTDADKADSAAKAQPTDYAALVRERRRPLDLSLKISAGKPIELAARSGNFEASASGQIPEIAKNRPMTVESVSKNLTKLGSTPFYADNVDIQLDENLILPLSAINALRREATDKLTEMLLTRRSGKLPDTIDQPQYKASKPLRTARFHSYDRIPQDASVYDIVYMPLERFDGQMSDRVNGVIIPPVVFDSESDKIEAMLKAASAAGIRHALVSNLGHIELAKKANMLVHGDFRLNIYNGWSAQTLIELGFADLMASPELTLPQLRDLGLSAVIYGRIPLMVLEKCVIRDLYSCSECSRSDFLMLRDRKGADFPITRAFEHRNILYNSVPIYMADRIDELRSYRIDGEHFIFTDETIDRAADIGAAYLGKATLTLPDGGIRRIAK